jgi:hypothetical protein
MLKKTTIGLAAISLSLAAAAFSPASANYAACTENPNAKGCPMYIPPTGLQGSGEQGSSKHLRHAHSHAVQPPSTKG